MNRLLSRFPKLRTRTLPAVMVLCGIVGLIFRLLLSVTALDDKGLLIPWHFTWICVLLVTIAAAAVLAVGVLPIRGPAAYRAAFPPAVFRGVGCGLAAGYTLATAVGHFRSGFSLPALLQGLLILLAAASFALVAFCRLFGKKPSFLFHVVICAWFALEMLNLYRAWSFDPQLHEYVFQLFACVALTAMAYQLAAFDMGRGSHRKIWAWGLAAVYLSCLAASDSLFFIVGGIWAFTNLTNLRRPRKRPAETEAIPAAE